MLNWNFTREEMLAVDRIVDKAVDIVPTVFDLKSRQSTMRMDLLAVHCNDMKLDLARMEKAPHIDLLHDLTGIAVNLNRETGKLENCFVPRFALKA